MQSKTAKSAAENCIRLPGQLGMCGGREVFLGFASAAQLCRLSFSDILDEATGTGYQRRFCSDHSLAFKRYIQAEGATTIPLTFNLRQGNPQRWSLERGRIGQVATLKFDAGGPPVMAQVDCQHRLGYLRESPINFAFMVFLGLTVEEEMRIFRDINGKAKGLNSSLLDYTEARLAQDDLGVAHPEIALALRLQEDPDSPWRHQLDLGGNRTNGTKRVASLRTMQKAIRRFRREARDDKTNLEEVGRQLIDFWRAVAQVYAYPWLQPRRHLIRKGIGVYSLMSMAGVLVREARSSGRQVDKDYYLEKLSDFSDRIDWSTSGPMKGFGGAHGADQAFELMKSIREQALRGMHGKQEHPAY
jgi:DGQHR domain-containing protein